MITIITTSQAPDAKPVATSVTLTTDWQPIIEVPSYEVPEESFGGGTTVVPGVGEILSPLIVTNTTTTSSTVSIRVYRFNVDATFILANQLPIAPNDVLPIPLNGQFIQTGDRLEVLAGDNNAIDITISYTLGQAEQDDVI